MAWKTTLGCKFKIDVPLRVAGKSVTRPRKLRAILVLSSNQDTLRDGMQEPTLLLLLLLLSNCSCYTRLITRITVHSGFSHWIVTYTCCEGRSNWKPRVVRILHRRRNGQLNCNRSFRPVQDFPMHLFDCLSKQREVRRCPEISLTLMKIVLKFAISWHDK